MSAIASLLRNVLMWVVTAAILLLLARYIVDISPGSNLLGGLAEWVRRATQPAISGASQLLDVRPRTGFWNPLPLGIAVALLIGGGIVSSLLDLLFVPPRRPEPPPRQADATAPVAQASAAAQSPAPAPDPVGSTTFNPQAAAAPAPARTRPAKIGRYEITDELGRGAMGMVYKALDPQIGRTVALKTVLSSGGSDTAAEEFKKRFFAEARAAGRLNHPGIMKVYDLLEDGHGHPCMVLEYFDGPTLDKLVEEQGRPSLADSLKIVTQAAQALAFAHDHGVVHRDIKPGNIMVAPSGHTILTDFGIAKLEDTHMTATGTILGTPAYMSPEQVQGLAVDHRTDIFSLGAVLYWLATGERPFSGATFTTIAYNVVHAEPRPIHEILTPTPPELEPVLSKCLAKAPMDRFQKAREFAEALRRVRLDDSKPATHDARPSA